MHEAISCQNILVCSNTVSLLSRHWFFKDVLFIAAALTA